MALQSSPVYHKMQEVFTQYEEGRLKGQKVHQMVGLTLQKAIEGRLAPKLPQFKVFQGLKVHKNTYIQLMLCVPSNVHIFIRQEEQAHLVVSTGRFFYMFVMALFIP